MWMSDSAEPQQPPAVQSQPKLPEVDSPPAEEVLDSVPSTDEVVKEARNVDEIVREQPTVDDLVGRDRSSQLSRSPRKPHDE